MAERRVEGACVVRSIRTLGTNLSTEVRNAGVLIGLENRDLGLKALGVSSSLTASTNFAQVAQW